MLLHRAGFNRSGILRRAVNHVYTVPIIKQQYDFPAALAPQADWPAELLRLLGHTSHVPRDDHAWRQARLRRMQAVDRS
jgi:ectoine hydroxylase-related dioxygenase (phytanoyl-CoA dioxygenase family)